MADDFYEELRQSAGDFGPPTGPVDDFYSEVKTKNPDFGAPTRQPSLNIAKGQGKGESFLTGAGYGLTKAGRGIEQAWLKLFGTPTEQEDLEKVIANEERIRKQIGSEWNPNAGWFSGGELTGQVLPGMAIPTPQSKSMAARALINAGIGGAYEGLTTTGGLGDRGVASILGAVGGAGGSVLGDFITKGWNRLRGDYTDPAAVELADRLRASGLKPRLGDVVSPEEGVLLKSGENLIARSPFGAGAVARDIEGLRRQVVPDNVRGENVVAEAVRQTETGVQKRADDIWNPFKTFVSQNQVPGVRPVNLQRGLREILKYDKGFLNDIKDDVLRNQLEALVMAKPNQLKAIPAQDYVELNSALSGLTPYIKARAQPAPGSTALADKQSYKRFAENIMEGMNQDWQVWKTYKSPNAKQARDLLDEAQKSWKAEILPWKRSDLAFKLGQIEQHGAPDTARLISGEPDTDAVSMLTEYIKRYGPYDGERPVEALTAMNRQGKILGSGEEPMSGTELTRGGVLGSPFASVSRKPGFQKYYLAKPQPQGPLMEMIKRGVIGTGRESGLESLVGAGIINTLLRGGEKEGSIGAQTENSFRHPSEMMGRQPIELVGLG